MCNTSAIPAAGATHPNASAVNRCSAVAGPQNPGHHPPAFNGAQTVQFGATSNTDNGLRTGTHGVNLQGQTGPVTDLQQLPTATHFQVRPVLDVQQRAAGLHMNQVTTGLGGNSHFANWWKVVPTDTSVVIVKGSAYAGQTVTLNGRQIADAGIVYLRRNAGYNEEARLDIAGSAGEKVEVFYYRFGPDSTYTVSADGKSVGVRTDGQNAMTGGDSHFRHVQFEILTAPSEKSLAIDPARPEGRWIHHNNDGYDWAANDPSFDAQSRRWDENNLGGDAAAHKVDLPNDRCTIDPMHFGDPARVVSCRTGR